MGELFSEFGDLVFTLVIGYISAIEFLYVVRHLYHYTFHETAVANSEYEHANENLSQLQNSWNKQLVDAKNREQLAGTQVMKDGVPYKDGFRVEAHQILIDQLKEQLKNKELSDLRRHELEQELTKQMKIAEQLRKELSEAEAKYQKQEQEKREKEEKDRKEAEKQALKLAEAERKREEEQRQKEEQEERKLKEIQEKQKKEQAEKELKEQEEQARKIAEAEKQREREQKAKEEREEAEEEARKLVEAEKQRVIQQKQKEQEEEQERLEAEENLRRIQALEKQKEEEERLKEEAQEAEAEAKRLLDIEHRLEEQLRAAEREQELTEKEKELIDSIKKRELKESEGNAEKEAELLRKILEAREQLGEESEEEQSLRLIQREKDQEAKQRRIEENALLFLEAEKEMADLQNQMLEHVDKRHYGSSLDSAPQTPAIEELCVKKTFAPLTTGDNGHHTVKTQLAQDLQEPYSVKTKPLLFPGVSDDASSIDPASSLQSSFSTQPSEEITTGPDSQYPPQERQEPEGEDNALNSPQYSDDYLRSLDGIKPRPLMREDGSGRRRAFKKRRSSNSSNSSRESRQSRDEELKMFTSLEEEEMRDNPDAEFTPIRYTSEPTLKVKGHHRRHKRSPAKDMRYSDESLRSSLERLGEETTSDPWGEVKPEQYKHSEFWKREKNLSIDEEGEMEKPASSEDVAYETATNMPSASSFEEATQMQNEEALTALQQHSANWNEREGDAKDKATAKDESARSDNTNLQTSQKAEQEASPARSSASPRLRRSPRVEEIDQYEERWNKSNDSAPSSILNTPTISVHTPLDFAPWRDEHGLMMEGLSDFYDFTASVNPSRSRPSSRNPSPANTAPNTPLPKDVSFQLEIANEERQDERETVEIYDDTDDLESKEFKRENIIKFIESINENGECVENKQDEMELEEYNEESSSDGKEVNEQGLHHLRLQNVADDANIPKPYEAKLMPFVNIVVDSAEASSMEVTESTDTEMNELVSSLRVQQASGRSRSRSKSPLPTPGNLQRSVENRRFKMIKHNEDILEKLIESKLLPELSPSETLETEPQTPQDEKETKIEPSISTDNSPKEEMNTLVQTLSVDTRRSRSKSPMRLPTAENLNKGLEKRRTKLIERNDELIKQLEEQSLTPESPTIQVEYIIEIEEKETTASLGNTPNITIESPQREEPPKQTENEEDDCSREKMELLVQTLREARSKSRSKSPMPHATEIENKRYSSFQNQEKVVETQRKEHVNPSINISEHTESLTESAYSSREEEECSREEMNLLVQSLRMARSRSRSPMPETQRAKTPEPSEMSDELENQRSRHSRSGTPSPTHSRSRSRSLPPRPDEIELAIHRSNTPSRSVSPIAEDYEEFHMMINLEGSENKTLIVNTEEQESLILANRQRQLDEEALEKLRNASEEMELRTLSPLVLDKDELLEEQTEDFLADLPLSEKAKLLRKSPTTPDYDRTISEEMRDVERIKEEMIRNKFKRSTYVGESLDLGSEFEPLRRETAKFQRSRSPSPTSIDFAVSKQTVEAKRQLQDFIIQQLTISNTPSTSNELRDPKSTGAIPKTERSCEIELTLTSEAEDTIRIKEALELEEMRRKNAEFRRSASASRSPISETEEENSKGQLKDRVLHEIAFHDFSRHLNSQFFDHERRASDSALIRKPEIQVQMHEDDDLEPEEYHHFRRFSLAQENQVEQYPSDDYIFIQQVEVRTRSGSRTWLREDFYSDEVDTFLANREGSKEKSMEKETFSTVDTFLAKREGSVETTQARESTGSPSDTGGPQAAQELDEIDNGADDDDEYSNASDDRQTVVEVDDEIDEDISDFNDRGPAEESHHETSECEEAEREMDRYADREASDWNRVVDVNDVFVNENLANELVTSEEEGAIGGSPYDSDSFAIDQIYDEAIKNRKQSGILREYDSILMQMSVNNDADDQYSMWSKTQGKRKPKNIEFSTQFLDNERRDSEMRYLGDANGSARKSVRLRSRYGYNPVLPTKSVEEVDMDYVPKREYNWRKNFKLDEEEPVKEDKEVSWAELEQENAENLNEDLVNKQWEEMSLDNENQENLLDKRKFSLGGESVTLFSQSPGRGMSLTVEELEINEQLVSDVKAKEEEEQVKEEKVEKPKKKKTKKKLHKETKDSLEESMNKEDEEAYDSQLNSRRSSSLQMETDSPKRKSRSRRSSKSSVTNEDSLGLFSPRSSVCYNEANNDIMEECGEASKESARPKKMKKRKKVKECMANVVESPIESREEWSYGNLEPLSEIATVSAVITPLSSSANILSSLSPQNSVCVTPASIETDVYVSREELREDSKEANTTASSSTTASTPSETLSRTSSVVTSPVDTFDIMKDANFYPLF